MKCILHEYVSLKKFRTEIMFVSVCSQSKTTAFDINHIQECQQEVNPQHRAVMVQLVQEVRTRRVSITRCLVRQTR